MIDTKDLLSRFPDNTQRTHSENCHEWHILCALYRACGALDAVNDLIKNATWAGGDGPIQCPWCAYGYKQPHAQDCRAAILYGWPMDGASFDAQEEEQERRISKPLKRKR